MSEGFIVHHPDKQCLPWYVHWDGHILFFAATEEEAKVHLEAAEHKEAEFEALKAKLRGAGIVPGRLREKA